MFVVSPAAVVPSYTLLFALNSAADRHTQTRDIRRQVRRLAQHVIPRRTPGQTQPAHRHRHVVAHIGARKVRHVAVRRSTPHCPHPRPAPRPTPRCSSSASPPSSRHTPCCSPQCLLLIVTPMPVIFAVRFVGWLKHVIPRRTPRQTQPAHRHRHVVAHIGARKVRHVAVRRSALTFPASPASTPANTTCSTSAPPPSSRHTPCCWPQPAADRYPHARDVRRQVRRLAQACNSPTHSRARLNPLTVTGTLLLTVALVKFATYPFVVQHSHSPYPPPAPRPTPPLFDVSVATVVPSYTLLFALNPLLIVTPTPVIFAVRFVGWLRV